MPTFDPRTTALVLIDLQNSVVGRDLAPRSGKEVIATSIGLAERFRTARAPVILVRVSFAPDFADAPGNAVDKPAPRPAGGMPAGWSDLIDGLEKPGDIVVTKRQWGAFYGTDLDVQLRRRGIRTIVLAGIATNMGVESTARQAWERSYDLIVVEDATASMSAEMHAFSIGEIMPRIGKVVKAADVTLASA